MFKPFHYCAPVTRFRVLYVISSGWIAWIVFSFGLRFSPNGMNLKTYSVVSSILISFTLIATVFVYIKLYNATKIKDCSVNNQSDPNRTSDINSQEAKTAKQSCRCNTMRVSSAPGWRGTGWRHVTFDLSIG